MAPIPAPIFMLTLSDPFSANDAVSAILGSQYFSSMSSAQQWPAVALELTAPLTTRTRIWSIVVLLTDMIREVRSILRVRVLSDLC